jgi:hypothetical protein
MRKEVAEMGLKKHGSGEILDEGSLSKQSTKSWDDEDEKDLQDESGE